MNVDALASLEGVERRRRRALVPHEPVRVVLQHVEVVRAGELHDPPAPLLAQRAPARVLEGRDRVEEGDVAAAAELGLERVGIEPFVVHLHRDRLDSLPAQELQRPVVGRPLDEHPAGAPLELGRGIEDEALEPARREEDAGRVDPVPLAEKLAERAVAPARAVREDHRAVPLQRGARAVRQKLRIDAGRRRGSARERDRCRRGHGASLPRAADAAATFLRTVGQGGRPVGSASFDSSWARRS